MVGELVPVDAVFGDCMQLAKGRTGSGLEDVAGAVDDDGSGIEENVVVGAQA